MFHQMVAPCFPIQQRGSTSRVSGPAEAGSAWPVRVANEASRSTWQTSASDVPGCTRPGRRTMNGTRVPPSNASGHSHSHAAPTAKMRSAGSAPASGEEGGVGHGRAGRIAG
ncbi:MAG: hypothetical protein U1F87_07630 [Kiritimatiellia bacterium]